MYPAAERVAANKAYNPEDEEDNCDSPKHFVVLLELPGFELLPCAGSQGPAAFLR